MGAIEESQGRMMVRSLRPSVRRALSSVLNIFAIPLLLLAAISAGKMLAALGLMEPYGRFKEAIEWQTEIVEYVRQRQAVFRLSISAYIFDVALFYIFVGNAVARAERDELLAVQLDEGTSAETFMRALKQWRGDYFFYGVPGLIRGVVLRCLWPIAAIYRMRTPWVVDGPGPDGQAISTSVPRSEIIEFARMVDEAGVWRQQTLYDHRLVFILQIILGVSSSLAFQMLSKCL